MRKLLLLFVLVLAACAPINNVDQAIDAVEDLDAKYNTNYRLEMVNKITLEPEEIDAYLKDLEGVQSRAMGGDAKQAKWVKYFLEARRQMLLAQKSFQKGWIEIGEEGRVSDGFACGDIFIIRSETRLLEDAWHYGLNSTGLLDTLMTENPSTVDRIGVSDNKPQIYLSDFEGLYTEFKSNVVAMHRFCDLEVKTEYADFSSYLDEEPTTEEDLDEILDEINDKIEGKGQE